MDQVLAKKSMKACFSMETMDFATQLQLQTHELHGNSKAVLVTPKSSRIIKKQHDSQQRP
jgi:hypothetical protein